MKQKKLLTQNFEVKVNEQKKDVLKARQLNGQIDRKTKTIYFHGILHVGIQYWVPFSHIMHQMLEYAQIDEKNIRFCNDSSSKNR